MSELLPRCARALSAADVRRCLEEALDAPSADGPTFREWYGSFFVFARDAPTLVLGISGCTRSGKSTLASALAEALGASKTAVIRQDRFASKVLAAQAEGGWESTDSIDFKAFRDAVVEASKGSKHFVIVEGFRAFASRPPGGVVDLLHHLIWIELSREACYERRMATTRVPEEYFDRNPQPFFSFAHELWPGRFNPTPCHRFIALLEKRGQLLRNYSQNIDTLEQSAGITRLVNCHGSFATATCVTCGYRCAGADIEDDILNQRIALCPKCPPPPPLRPVNQAGENSGGSGCSSEGAGGSSGGGSGADGAAAAADPGADGGHVLASPASDKAAAREGAPEESKLMRDPMEEQDLASMGLASRGVMKPDIVFFKESLPTNFFASLRDDMQAVDLLEETINRELDEVVEDVARRRLLRLHVHRAGADEEVEARQHVQRWCTKVTHGPLPFHAG